MVNFHQNLQKKRVKNDNCVLNIRLLPEIAKTFQFFFGACFSYMLHELTQIFLKNNENDKIWRILGNFLKKTKKFPKNEN